MKKILITGGNGFVGRNFIKHLRKKKKYRIILIPRNIDLRLNNKVDKYFKNIGKVSYIFHVAEVSGNKEWSKKNNYNLQGKKYIVQGFGKVGFRACEVLSTYGMNLVAVADHTCYLYLKEGFNVFNLRDHISENKVLKGYEHGEEISKEEFFKINCNVIIPSALELQIDENIAKDINCDLIVEAANGPIDNEAELILEGKNIPIIPDILANSGGVLVSYYEWLQNKRDEYWEESYIRDKFDKKMEDTFEKIYKISIKHDCTLRDASYIYSLGRLESNYLSRN